LQSDLDNVANKTLNVTVGSKELTQVGSVHYLQVTIDPSLSWNLQVSNVVCRIQSRVASLLQFGSLSPVIVCALYTAFMLPLYDYCDVVWSPTTSKFTSMLERVHSKFTRKLILSCTSKLPFMLTECQRYHSVI